MVKVEEKEKEEGVVASGVWREADRTLMYTRLSNDIT